jgi:hypothetical protein
MAKKINMTSVKEFLFNHGEKVALGTCALLAVVFGALGLARAFSAGKADSGLPWAKAFDKKGNEIATAMAAVREESTEDMANQLKPSDYVWDEKKSNFEQTQYIYFAGAEGNKRINPQALPIQNVQLDYVRGLVWLHAIEGNKLLTVVDAGAAEGVPPATITQPKFQLKEQESAVGPVMKRAEPIRMIVVTAVFPMKKQIEEFQRALKMTSQKEMFDQREDLPKVLGIDVFKFELVNKKKVNEEGEILMWWNGKELKKGKALDDLLRFAIYDEAIPVLLEPYLHAGLVTPMPKLANAFYPKSVLPGMEIAWEELKDAKADMVGALPPGEQPKVPGDNRPKKLPRPESNPGMEVAGAKKPGIPIGSPELKKTDIALYNRLFEKPHDYNLYHVLGLYPPKATEEPQSFGPPDNVKPATGKYFAPWDVNPPSGGGAAGIQPGGELRKNKPRDPLDTNFPNWNRDAFVRFIDPGVEPGKSYQYVIQVRLANPNHGKKDLVAYADLATKFPEIASPPVWTSTIDIPHEHFLYAVDQHTLDEWEKPQPKKGPPPTPEKYRVAKDQTVFQIHQWTKMGRDIKRNGFPYTIGDWAIAERVLVRRGEAIGEKAFVQVPFWNKDKDTFEIPPKMNDPFVKKGDTIPGLLMDFKEDGQRPVLVDFAGGKRYKANNTLEEETAVEALILTPDGKLTVLNSRADADAIQEEPAIQISRQDRVTSARRRFHAVQNGTHTDPMKSNGPPKVPLREGKGGS